MSKSITFQDFAKSLPVAADATGLFALLADANGEPKKVDAFSFKGIETGYSASAANVLRGLGLFLCVAFSESDRFINNVFVVLQSKFDSVFNLSSSYSLGSSGGLVLNAVNSYGTPSLKMSDNSPLPSDLRYLYLRIALPS